MDPKNSVIMRFQGNYNLAYIQDSCNNRPRFSQYCKGEIQKFIMVAQKQKILDVFEPPSWISDMHEFFSDLSSSLMSQMVTLHNRWLNSTTLSSISFDFIDFMTVEWFVYLWKVTSWAPCFVIGRSLNVFNKYNIPQTISMEPWKQNIYF